jgi:tRNA-dihydrouridine synthase B
VAAAFDRYGVDGAMIGRAALGRPWLFRQGAAAIAGEPIPPEPTLDRQRQVLLDHFRLMLEQHGPERGTMLMRCHACHYGGGRAGAKSFRRQIAQAAGPEEFIAIVHRVFPRD